MNIGDQLRQARTRAGLTQRALAVRAGLPAETVSRIERGASVPRPATLTALAQALDVPAALFLVPGAPPEASVAVADAVRTFAVLAAGDRDLVRALCERLALIPAAG